MTLRVEFNKRESPCSFQISHFRQLQPVGRCRRKTELPPLIASKDFFGPRYPHRHLHCRRCHCCCCRRRHFVWCPLWVATSLFRILERKGGRDNGYVLVVCYVIVPHHVGLTISPLYTSAFLSVQLLPRCLQCSSPRPLLSNYIQRMNFMWSCFSKEIN